ncbi:MAG: hypothetical protein DCC75_04320 [Proteobacteria bacterium]|nr:MAG: hypothetical protein DCC75_04320 [Pseudomonadota bacterium]
MCPQFQLLSRPALTLIIICLFSLAQASAQSRTNLLQHHPDPRGEPELTVCSQNLKNYGLLTDMKRKDPSVTNHTLADKEAALAQRIAYAKCDVVAVQELLGKEDAAIKALESLALAIRWKTNRFFKPVIGPTNDRSLRNGFLYAADRAELGSTISYYRIELPKLTTEQKPRYYPRGPLEIQLFVKGRDGSPVKTVSLVNFHFKSRSGAQGDPAALQWETYRMEMAEGLRRVVESRHRGAFASGDTILVVLGDRNSHFDTASAKILEGVLTLDSFKESAPCRLSKRGMPLCQAGSAFPQRLFSVLSGDPQTKDLPGTFVYKETYSWLDDIFLPQESLRYAWTLPFEEGDFDSGVIYSSKDASDHSLVFVRLNW